MTTATLTTNDFTFNPTEGEMQDRNPGYGVWMTEDRQTAIIQVGVDNGRYTSYIPCRRNRSGSLQGLHAFVASCSFDGALADLRKDAELKGPKFRESGDVREVSRVMFDPSLCV